MSDRENSYRHPSAKDQGYAGAKSVGSMRYGAPRSFDITPDGRFILGAGEGSGKLAFFECLPETGRLTRLKTYDVGRSLTWVLVVD
jgi:6-phosphogluconolactonase (cycloisomerase 2 family)